MTDGNDRRDEQTKNLFRLIKKDELATALSVSPRTVEGWVKAKRVPVYKLGRRCVRFNLTEVITALKKFRFGEAGEVVFLPRNRHQLSKKHFSS